MAVGIYSELRRRSFEPTPSQDRIFRCRRCGYVYTDDPDVDRSRCSQCGLMNEAIEF
jgi:predicted Zn-ribbon and HTH transcriptional regulator